MKIEKVNDNIIKVTISSNDLRERNLDVNSIKDDSKEVQDLLSDMIEQAEIQFGFKVSDSQLCIEPQDTPEGFILMISKIDDEVEYESLNKFIKNKLRNNDISFNPNINNISTSILLYSFTNFEHLNELCNRLYMISNCDSSLYQLNSTYYLFLTKDPSLLYNTKLFDAILNEYGTKISNINFYQGYLNEYGKELIHQNAVETIHSYFN